MSLSSGKTPVKRAFGIGQVTPAGWQATRGAHPGLTGTVAAVSSSVGPARWRCAEFAQSLGASAEVVEAVMLSVSEAVTNVVLYAYPNGRTGVAHIDAALRSGRLLIVVADDGIGIAPLPESIGLGRGLAIVNTLASELNVVSKPGQGTRVEMIFELG
jgi:anti-sigma regulatory factor (Ser/Thr protein kinase)